jgi:hypothetical protein
LKPTYRGKPKNDAEDLDTKNVRRFSIMSRRYVSSFLTIERRKLMMHSFFGEQEGDFSLEIKSITAVSQSDDLEGGMVRGNNVSKARSRL